MYNVHTIKLLAICPSTCHIPTKYKIRELSSPTTEPPLCSHGLDPRVSTLDNVRNDNVSRDQIKMLQWPAAGFFGFFCSFCIGQQFKWAAWKKCEVAKVTVERIAADNDAPSLCMYTKHDKKEEVDKNWQCGRDGGMDGMVAEGGWCLGSGAARPPDDKMELSGVK